MQLDSKKSPLALLAQTCSSIGKDTSPTKPLISSSDKRDYDKSTSEKPGSADSNKRSSPHEKKDSSSKETTKPGFRTIHAPPKDIPPLVPIASSPNCEKSVYSASSSELCKSTSSESTTVTSVIQRPVSATGSTTSSHNSSSRISLSCGNVMLEANHNESSTSTKNTSQPQMVPSNAHLGSLKHPPHPSLYHGLPAGMHLGSYPNLSLYGHGLAPEAAANPLYQSQLSAHAAGLAVAANASALKMSSAASVSPYVAYARVRTPSGGTTLIPICRDPYCTNCQLTLQNSHLSSTCTAPGCAQCAHEKSLTLSQSSYGYSSLPNSSLAMLSSLSSAGALPSMSTSSFPHGALYHPNLMGAHHAAGLPYVCNWVSGHEYCGKRFTTSEELLQHLRTHTSSIDASSLAAYNLALPGASALAGLHGPYPSTGGLSPNSLRRTYPTSLSPVSNLLSSNRFHPYKSSLSSVQPVPTGMTIPGLGAYYSPYSLYGQRLGAAGVP